MDPTFYIPVVWYQIWKRIKQDV